MMLQNSRHIKKNISCSRAAKGPSDSSSLIRIDQVDSVKLRTSFEFNPNKKPKPPKELEKI